MVICEMIIGGKYKQIKGSVVSIFHNKNYSFILTIILAIFNFIYL
jgi:hypothetical protein